MGGTWTTLGSWEGSSWKGVQGQTQQVAGSQQQQVLQAEGVLGKCSVVTENTGPTSGQRWANGMPWEDLHRWMTVLAGPSAPITLSITRGLGEPLPAPGPIGHPSHSREPWVEVPGVHTSHQAPPGRPPFYRVIVLCGPSICSTIPK